MSVRAGLPLAVTLGEPAGIGPDLTLAIWRRRRELDLPSFYVVGDSNFLDRRARRLGLDIALAEVAPHEAAAAFADALPVVPLALAVAGEPGAPDETSAPAVIASIRRAVADVMEGRAAAVVTNPIAKNVLYRAGFIDPGHTEYLARLCEQATGKPVMPVMLLWSPELAVVPVTIHIPLKDVITQLTTDLIVETGRIVSRDMAARFRIARPRLALAGLNPHAGEHGMFGSEETREITPAIEACRTRDQIQVSGPFPADTLFVRAARGEFDAVAACYHDQGLIAVKCLAFGEAVNVTLGLPIIRTSVDHGTAFDIAGRGIANHASLVEAIALAARLVKDRTEVAPAPAEQ